MKPTSFIWAGALALSLFVPVAASAQSRVELQLVLDLRVLEEQNRQLMQAVNTLNDQIKTVNAKVDSEATARSKGFADQQTTISNVTSNLSALQEKVSDSKVQIQKVTQELDAIRKGVDMLTVMVTQTLGQLPANAPPAAAPGSDASAPGAQAAPAAPVATGVPASCHEYYDTAYGDYAVAQYDIATKGFQEFLKQCPTDLSAPRAQFLIGESFYLLGKYQDAINAYDQVIQKFKTTDPEATSDAYYKQGLAYDQLKQRDKAVINYQLLRKDYPDSNAALQATQELKRLGILK